MQIEAIDDSSPHLEAVKKLWRAHSDTLGFLPDGGFQDYARERHVVVARPRLGFHPIGEKPGRAAGKELVVWWQGHGHRDLLSGTEQPGAIEAAVDANIFFDLVDKTNEESLWLVADWLRPFVTICNTPEPLIEIDRNQNPQDRKQRRTEAEQFKQLASSAEAFQLATLYRKETHIRAGCDVYQPVGDVHGRASRLNCVPNYPGEQGSRQGARPSLVANTK